MRLVKPSSQSPRIGVDGRMTAHEDQALTLESLSVDALPLVNHFLTRLGFDRLLEAHVPAVDRRYRLRPARTLGVLLRNLMLARVPLYSQQDWARRMVPHLLGLSADEVLVLNDDRVGRALDALFLADRATLLTQVVVSAVRAFDVNLAQLHNDSTTVTFSGNYSLASGRCLHGKQALSICHGHNKDHRPDLKQLLFVLTVSSDGAVPVHFQALDGNTADVDTHIATWEVLRSLAGRPDFLYVADCKLCSAQALRAIASCNGRFLTILPRNRREHSFFCQWLQQHPPAWEHIAHRSDPRHPHGPSDLCRTVESPIPSAEGFRIVWIHSSLKLQRDQQAREEKIAAAAQALEEFRTHLRSPRSRYTSRPKVEAAASKILSDIGALRWIDVRLSEHLEPVYRQEKRGRPGPKARYVRRHRLRLDISWQANLTNVEYDARCDGVFPFITNCRDLTPAQLLQAYKYQPNLEKRHEQFKSVYEVTPVWLKNEGRVEALLFLYYVVLLAEALIEREIRQSMKARGVGSLPLYPEERDCRAPSTQAVFQAFAGLQHHRLTRQGTTVRSFPPVLSPLQLEVLDLLNAPISLYSSENSQ
jgi:transposase